MQSFPLIQLKAFIVWAPLKKEEMDPVEVVAVEIVLGYTCCSRTLSCAIPAACVYIFFFFPRLTYGLRFFWTFWLHSAAVWIVITKTLACFPPIAISFSVYHGFNSVIARWESISNGERLGSFSSSETLGMNEHLGKMLCFIYYARKDATGAWGM